MLRTFLIAVIAAISIGPSVIADEPGFSGAVKDTAGKLLAGVEILVIVPSTSSDLVQPLATVRSNTEGRFMFQDLEAGAYQIAAVKRGYRTYIGQINTRILAVCRDIDLPAVGISGVDAGLIRANKRPPVDIGGDAANLVDYGFVGDIESVDADVLRTQLASGLVPVISPLSADSDGTVLNINADTVAAALAGALDAEKLILVTGAPGILEDRADPNSLISYIDLAGLAQLKANGSLAEGMLPKAAAIENAIQGGVQRVHVISYKLSDSLLLEVFTNEGNGTLVVGNINMLSPEEQSSGATP